MRSDFKYVPFRLTEEEVINRLVFGRDLSGRHDLRCFGNVLLDPIGTYDYPTEYHGYHIARNIKREEIGFDGREKPGDFDVIFIPFGDSKIFFERTAAVEVKIVRPTKRKPRKDSNSTGLTQTMGLVRDGFPVVGLLHVCMTEPIDDKDLIDMPMVKQPINVNDHKKNPPQIFNDLENIKLDTFPQFAVDNQLRRLVTMELPNYVGIEAISMNAHVDATVITSMSMVFNGYKSAYFNPHVKDITIQKIGNYFGQSPGRFTKILL